VVTGDLMKKAISVEWWSENETRVHSVDNGQNYWSFKILFMRVEENKVVSRKRK
jgi:hypothetical protein